MINKPFLNSRRGAREQRVRRIDGIIISYHKKGFSSSFRLKFVFLLSIYNIYVINISFIIIFKKSISS